LGNNYLPAAASLVLLPSPSLFKDLLINPLPANFVSKNEIPTNPSVEQTASVGLRNTKGIPLPHYFQTLPFTNKH
jgi:hypothetical protein